MDDHQLIDGVRQLAEPPPGSHPIGVKGVWVLEIDTTLYALPALWRACYALSDRCYLFLARGSESRDRVTVALSVKGSGEASEAALGDFCNALIDHQLRHHLAEETAGLRELIVAQAFAEGNLLEPDEEGR
jgi:His-Xaa-Ser system protein HxsD